MTSFDPTGKAAMAAGGNATQDRSSPSRNVAPPRGRP
jgi:hypothetical protein